MSPLPAHPGPDRTSTSISDESGQTVSVTSATLTSDDIAVAVALQPNSPLPAGTNTIGLVDQGTGGSSAWKVDGSAVTQPASLSTAYGKTLTFVAVAQGGAGTTTLAAADATKKHKLVGGCLTLGAAGTVKFSDNDGDLTGALSLLASTPLVLPTSLLPYFQTNAINKKLDLTSVTGAATGWVAILTEA